MNDTLREKTVVRTENRALAGVSSLRRFFMESMPGSKRALTSSWEMQRRSPSDGQKRLGLKLKLGSVPFIRS
jgi:hypothetical protein